MDEIIIAKVREMTNDRIARLIVCFVAAISCGMILTINSKSKMSSPF